jgi:hypothetical protein
MWFIKHQVSGKYFQDFQAPPNDDQPIWVDTTGEAKSFNGLEEEEDFRNINLPFENAQPFEAP